MHSATRFSPFELVYGFNPLTPIDLLPLPLHDLISLDGDKKAVVVQDIHAKAKARIEKITTRLVEKRNAGRNLQTFEVGD